MLCVSQYNPLYSESSIMASKFEKLHFIMFPLMSQGHMIPIIDIAKLLAQRGATITITTTPLNANRYRPIISRAVESGLRVSLHELQFPSIAAGLPEGCENFDMLPSLGLGMTFISSMALLEREFDEFMEKVEPRPSCVISDILLTFTTDVARKFGIPRIVFNGPGCFPLMCSYYIAVANVHANVCTDSEPFSVPGLPDQTKFMKKQLDDPIDHNSKEGKEFIEKLVKSEMEAYGIVVNTFEELEAEYVKEYMKLKPNKVWCIGPVSLCSKDNIEKGQRGNKNSIDEIDCLKWLDSMNSCSVIYACLGSINNLKPAQMMELGLGLESSNKPFIWVIRENEDARELKELITENGIEERVKGRGVLIWGWAPQVLILSHPSIGAFLTHCGWNSTLEGVTAGLPMITWPLFADQFFNEKLAVDILGIGVSVGAEAAVKWGEEEKIGVLVKKEDVENAVNTVMDEGEEGKERRRKARELREMANRAMEDGGSSYLGLTQFLEDIMQMVSGGLRAGGQGIKINLEPEDRGSK